MAAVRVRMTTGLRAASESWAWVGAQEGIFRKHGLEVDFPRLEVGGPEAAEGLVRGEWDFVQTGVAPIAEAVLNGADPVILLRNNAPSSNIVVMTRSNGLRALQGKLVGVLTEAGQVTIIAKMAVEREGASAQYIPLGTYQNIFEALISGRIDAGALPIDYRFVGESRYGISAYETGVSSLPTIFATTRRLVASNRDTAINAVRAFVETLHVIRTRPDAVVPHLQRFLGFDDERSVRRLRDYYSDLLPVVPRPCLGEGVATLKELFRNKYPLANELTEQQIVDDSIIDEVERSGFIAALMR